MSNYCIEEKHDRIKELIVEFCGIILTEYDTLYKNDVENYINSLSDEDIGCLNVEEVNKDPIIKGYVLDEVVKYINRFYNRDMECEISKPFEFDSACAYDEFCDHCKNYYKKQKQNNKLPSVLEYTLNYIHEISDHYRIFGHFYDYKSAITIDQISDFLKKITIETTKEEVEKKLGQFTEEMIVKKVDDIVENKTVELSNKVSETSVTILGMFTGIVLTVVAGLFYSSSVIDNINSADFCKLISISSLIGFVCLNLLAVMFRFVERIRNPKKTDMPRFSRLTLFVSISLLVVMIVFAILHFRGVEDNNVSQEETNSDFEVSSEMQFTVDSEAKTPLEDLPQPSNVSDEE